MPITITSHAAGIVDPTVHADGTVTLSVPAYYIRKDRHSRRQIMETSENGEEIMDTIKRALDDEISEEPGSATLTLLDEKPFFTRLTADESHPGGTHLKAFFFVKVTGRRRTKAKSDGKEELGPMIDIEIGELLSKMKKEGTVPVHLQATQAALWILVNKHESVYNRYHQFAAQFPEPLESTPEEWTAIRNYSKWFKAA
jgi:hypothetical protein